MKHVPAVLLFFLAMSMPLFAQTTYNLPSTLIDVTIYPTYENLFANDIPVTMGGQSYYFNVTGQFQASNPSNVTVMFQNLTTYVEMPEAASASFVYQDGSHVTVAGTFSGAPFNGSFTLDLVKHIRTGYCGRYGCHPYWTQQNSTLTID